AIEPSHFAAGTAYLVVDNHRLDDDRPYLWKTADFGRTWRRLDGNLPRGLFLHVVREDPRHAGLLYLGTEHGVAFSADDGATWHSLRLNLPPVGVHDLAVKDGALVLAPHGRSFWMFDDLEAVALATSAMSATSATTATGGATSTAKATSATSGGKGSR